MNSLARKQIYLDYEAEELSPDKLLIGTGRAFRRDAGDGIIEAIWRKIRHRHYTSGVRVVADLPNDLQNAVRNSDVEPNAQAIKDAAIFLGRISSAHHPRLEITESGSVVIHWRARSVGLLVVATGDGTVTYSIKRPGGSYATSGIEIDMSRRIPGEVVVAIEEIERDAIAP